MKGTGISLIQLPTTIDLILVLIKEELKSHKFFGVLRSIGLDDSYFQTDLSSLILTYTGLSNESNETMDFYFNLLNKYSPKIEANDDSVTEQALHLYTELIQEKRRRSNEH